MNPSRVLRIQQHQELANQLLGLGDDHYIEEMAFRALVKKAKPQEPAPGETAKWRIATSLAAAIAK